MRPSRVTLAMVEDVLAAVADVIHDRPVQSMVAARLLIETAVPPGTAPGDSTSDILHKGVGAVSTAAEQCRELMWALSRPEVREGSMEEDLQALAQRVVTPAGTVDVVLGDDESPATVLVLARAIHLLGAGVNLGGGTVRSVSVESDAEELVVEVVVEGRTGAEAWRELATAHVEAVSGRSTTVEEGEGRWRTIIAVPQPS